MLKPFLKQVIKVYRQRANSSPKSNERDSNVRKLLGTAKPQNGKGVGKSQLEAKQLRMNIRNYNTLQTVRKEYQDCSWVKDVKRQRSTGLLGSISQTKITI